MKNKKIQNMLRDINEFKKGYQVRSNFVKDKKCDLSADSHSILNRWKNHFCLSLTCSQPPTTSSSGHCNKTVFKTYCQQMAETVVLQHNICPISGTGIIRNDLNKKIIAFTTPK